MAVTAVLAAGCSAEKTEPGGLPELAGLEKSGEERRFDTEGLYEHINGAAPTYLGFGFQELVVQEYTTTGGGTLTAEVYRQADPNNGFGIYSYEKPNEGPFLEIGAEGYYETGFLAFVQGPHYVKLYGMELGDEDESVLTGSAEAIANALGGDSDLPPTAASFPQEGLVPHSVRFVGKDFLGHGFLHSAFVAEYETGDGRRRAFIIESPEPDGSGRMLQEYLALLERKGESHRLEDGVYRFADPYQASAGTLNLKEIGGYLAGVFHDDPSSADEFLAAVESNLTAR
jgi:hypothetical protein